MLNMTKKYANEITGGLSQTSKMGCQSYGIPVEECKTGAILRAIPNSTCSKCYGFKGNYRRYPAILKAQYRRFDLLLKALSDLEFRALWIRAITTLIGKDSKFRWHDVGDLQSMDHLQLICDIARMMPECKFWLPTREKCIVERFSKANDIPANLVIRVSAAMIDGKPSAAAHTSTVHSNVFNLIGFECSAPANNGECGSCTACWDPSVKNVSYKQH